MAQTDERKALATVVEDLREEAAELDSLAADLAPADWQRVTAFKAWTVYDVIAHLHLSDHMGLAALSGEAAFQALMQDMRASGTDMAGFARRWLEGVEGAQLHRRWRDTMTALCDGLAAADPAKRLPWVGPGMKPRMFATARQMETWAHGWELYDLLGVPRRHGARLENIATIGVRTFGWTFSNRDLAVPEVVPFVGLTGPAGEHWTWNDPACPERVEGDAVAFCQVVTQVRHVDDTDLTVTGDVARRWMAMAQCFAGPPVDPPAPGSRVPGGTPAYSSPVWHSP